MTTKTDLLPLPPLYIVPSVEPVDYPDVAQALIDYARANVARAIAAKDAEIDALRTRLEDTVRDSTNKIEALRARVGETKEVAVRAMRQRDAQYNRAERLAEALEEIRSRSSIDLTMRSDQFALTALLGDIHQIAGAELAQEGEQ